MCAYDARSHVLVVMSICDVVDADECTGAVDSYAPYVDYYCCLCVSAEALITGRFCLERGGCSGNRLRMTFSKQNAATAKCPFFLHHP